VLLDKITVADPPPFALVRRAEGVVDVLVGDVVTVAELANIPVSDHDVLAVVPYRQITERGFDCVDDHAPLLVLRATERETVGVDQVLERIEDVRFDLTDPGFDLDDGGYAETVRKVLAEEIGQGAGANFVLMRSFTATIADYRPVTALAVFRRLLISEPGAYWTFLVDTGDRTFVGATPERHVSVADGTVTMNPISGTYRHTEHGPDLAGLLSFLADTKEIDELYMVVDEELKMMAEVGDLGGRVLGPYLRQMSRLTHTEYLLVGRTSLDVREVLRRTMFAPTVTGSPLENACRVIARYERNGRGYYAGVLALIERGGTVLDAPILIRTAEISRTGSLRVSVGATLVRDSVPAAEVAETHAKAAAVLDALHGRSHRQGLPAERFSDDAAVQESLVVRNNTLAAFWLNSHSSSATPLAGRRALMIDAEDTFTAMLAHLLRTLGLTVTRVRYDQFLDTAAYDLVVVGPGPGDPRVLTDSKMATLRSIVSDLVDSGQPMLAICLGHQVLSSTLGLALVRKNRPYQGVQRRIDLFGTPERVGFYSTFVAVCDEDSLGEVTVCRDRNTGEVHALRGPRFVSTQFHPESVLTEHGIDILAGLLTELIPGSSSQRRQHG